MQIAPTQVTVQATNTVMYNEDVSRGRMLRRAAEKGNVSQDKTTDTRSSEETMRDQQVLDSIMVPVFLASDSPEAKAALLEILRAHCRRILTVENAMQSIRCRTSDITVGGSMCGHGTETTGSWC